MQEEVEQRIVSLMISCGKLGEQEFRKAIAKLLEQLKNDRQKHQYSKANPHGKMTVKQLAAKDKGLQSIEVTDQNKFRVTPQEREMIETKMAQFGTTNMAAYLRKMAIDGYVVKLDLPELRELVSLLRYSSNNLNQLTRRAHETGRIYETDLEDIQQSQERIWTAAEKIVSSLAALK